MNVLAKAKSVEDVQSVCETAFLYRDLSLASYPESAVGDVAKKFSCTKGETRQMLGLMSKIVGEVIIVLSDSDTSQSLDAAFPANFPGKLKKSCEEYFQIRFPDWRQSILKTKGSYPKLLDVHCVTQMNQEQTTPTCLLQLKVENGQTDSTEREESYQIQLNKDNINMMLTGLNKIKDQLSSVAQ